MYLWKVDNLVEDFKSGKVSQKEEFKYMLLFTVLIIFSSDPLLYIDSSYNTYDFVSSLLWLASSVWGIYYCYKINSEGDNKDFIIRVMCIGLPVAIRVLVFLIPIILLIGFVEGFSSVKLTAQDPNAEAYDTTAYQVVTSVIYVVSYYMYLAKKIRAVSSLKVLTTGSSGQPVK